MSRQEDWRDEFLRTLNHIREAYQRVAANSGPGRILTAPDVHKLAEGLFLSAWTHWEEFVRKLFVLDLAEDGSGSLRREVSKFRLKRSHDRLAQLLVDHPDEQRWVEWSDVAMIKRRADRLLGSSHRFGVLVSIQQNFQILRTIRNAVAHKSDTARNRFLRLVAQQPFSLTPRQRKGITVGRFLIAHQWSGSRVIEKVLDTLEDAASQLVP